MRRGHWFHEQRDNPNVNTNIRAQILAERLWANTPFAEAGRRMPFINFELDPGLLDDHAYGAAYWDGNKPRGLQFGNEFTRKLAQEDHVFHPLAVLHEFAHSQQTPDIFSSEYMEEDPYGRGGLINWLAEGGAEAWVERHGGRILKKSRTQHKRGKHSPGYTKQLERAKRRGDSWIEKGQFGL